MNLEKKTLPYKSYHQQLIEANTKTEALRELISTLGELLVKEQEARILYEDAVWKMVNDGWLVHGPEGMSEAQQAVYDVCKNHPELKTRIKQKQEEQRNYEEATNRNVRLESTPGTYVPNPKPLPAWRRLFRWL